MRLASSAALLGLAWFAAANIVATGIAWGLARTLRVRETSGNLLLALRILPAASAAVFVLGVFLPAHVRFEPERVESFGVVLGLLAAFALGLFFRSAWRVASIVRTARRFAGAVRASSPLYGEAVCEVNGFPGVTLAGVFRPRILIGSEAMAALTPAELEAAIAHEVAHRHAADNLKRLAMFCAPDLFSCFGMARALEDRWQAAAEYRADAYAVNGDATRAVTLASALVKVARLTAEAGAMRQSPAWSAFHVPTLLEARVRRLVADAVPVPDRRGRIARIAATIALGASVGVWYFGLSYELHAVTESLVTFLP